MLKRLVNTARKAQSHAYAPYSGFPVGAAILADNDQIYTGCNIENSSYGLTMCAERNALASLVAASRGLRPVAIAVVGRAGEPCYPCGACRQVLAEFNPHMKVVLESGQELLVRSLHDYLPYRFELKE
jgi:cytidine deaminase